MRKQRPLLRYAKNQGKISKNEINPDFLLKKEGASLHN